MGRAPRNPFPEPIGASEPFLRLGEALSRAATVNRPVLLIGERGTGKELAARKLHYLSPRWQGPLVTLNCAALPPSLIESELFGHEPGAFTGAAGRRVGRFEAADEGTLFLDEIALIPLVVQEKILRAVEYGSFERVGSSHPTSVDVRIVGATNADLARLAADGGFKQDLLDRLSFEVVHLPPLRDRGDDMLLLAHHFASRMAAELGRDGIPAFSPRAEAALRAHPWPGNIRELKNVIERSVYRCDDPVIDDIVFDPFGNDRLQATPTEGSLSGNPSGGQALRTEGPHSRPEGMGHRYGPSSDSPQPSPIINVGSAPEPEGLTFAEAVAGFEAGLIRKALEEARFNQRRAAEKLGLSYDQFRGMYRKHKDRLA